jgi:hypothetical protein
VKGTERIQGALLLTIILFMAVVLSSCIQRNTSDTEDAGPSGTVSTEEFSQNSTPTPKPTPKPTPTGTPTPTPEPVSVYIPREVLPDGRLFDQEYYAVLPGEGAYYNVFDCYGKLIDSFFYDTGYGDEPIGLLKGDELAMFHLLNEDKVRTIKFTDQKYTHSDLNSCGNGLYQMWYGEDTQKIVLYDNAGNHIRTMSFDDEAGLFWGNMGVRSHGDEIVVICTSQPREWDGYLEDTTTTVYFIGMDGTINDKVEVKSYDFTLFARKYLGPDYYNETISDLDGNVLMEDVSYYFFSTFFGYPDSPYRLEISDYFVKDGKVYDASLQPVKQDTVGADGNLIYGLEYDVSGIICTAVYSNSGYEFDGYYDSSQLTAIGYKDKQVGVKTSQGEYVIDIETGLKFGGINHYGYLLHDEHKGTIQIISLETREVLCTISGEPPYSLPEEYFILSTVREVDGDQVYGQVIYDREGNRRYAGENIGMRIMPGENILLYRGPYVGIADLNGEWILKTLTWEMTRDAEEVEPFY